MESGCKKTKECFLGCGLSLNRLLGKQELLLATSELILQALENATAISLQ